MADIFEQATRQKRRFKSNRGLLTTEDLWDLPLEELDSIAISLFKVLKDEDEVSFIKERKDELFSVKLNFDVVKHIIDTRLAEQQAEKSRADLKQREQKLLRLIEMKQEEKLQSKSEEELWAELESLKAE
jgi:hypothetical protein